MLADFEFFVEQGSDALSLEPVGGASDEPVGGVDFGFKGGENLKEELWTSLSEGGEATLNTLEVSVGGALGVVMGGVGVAASNDVGGGELLGGRRRFRRFILVGADEGKDTQVEAAVVVADAEGVGDNVCKT